MHPVVHCFQPVLGTGAGKQCGMVERNLQLFQRYEACRHVVGGGIAYLVKQNRNRIIITGCGRYIFLKMLAQLHQLGRVFARWQFSVRFALHPVDKRHAVMQSLLLYIPAGIRHGGNKVVVKHGFTFKLVNTLPTIAMRRPNNCRIAVQPVFVEQFCCHCDNRRIPVR